MRDFRVLPEVAEDIAEVANWYDGKGYIGLGERFIQTFYSYIPYVLKNGDIHRVVYSDFRKILIPPFPYFLFYRYHGDLLIITLVIGAVRRPSLIRQVLRSRK
jgi:hypothetical protein